MSPRSHRGVNNPSMKSANIGGVIPVDLQYNYQYIY